MTLTGFDRIKIIKIDQTLMGQHPLKLPLKFKVKLVFSIIIGSLLGSSYITKGGALNRTVPDPNYVQQFLVQNLIYFMFGMEILLTMNGRNFLLLIL